MPGFSHFPSALDHQPGMKTTVPCLHRASHPRNLETVLPASLIILIFFWMGNVSFLEGKSIAIDGSNSPWESHRIGPGSSPRGVLGHLLPPLFLCVHGFRKQRPQNKRLVQSRNPALQLVRNKLRNLPTSQFLVSLAKCKIIMTYHKLSSPYSHDPLPR